MRRLLSVVVSTLLPTIATGFDWGGPKEDRIAGNTFYAHSVLIAKEHDLCLLNMSTTTLADAKYAYFALSLTSSSKMTIEEARPYAASLAKALLSKMHHDPILIQYQEKNCQSRSSSDVVAFKLAFWDENVDRPLFPYLAQVRLADSNVYFYYANPKTQALVPPIIETLSSLNVTEDTYIN